MDTPASSNKKRDLAPAGTPPPQPADAAPVNASKPTTQPPMQPYYMYQDEEEQEGQDQEMSGQFATPFQRSSPIPVIEMDQVRSSEQTEQSLTPSSVSVPTSTKTNRFTLPKIALIVTALVVASGFLWFSVSPQPAQSLTLSNGATSSPQKSRAQASSPASDSSQPVQHTATPVFTPTPTPTVRKGQASGSSSSGTWIPQELPDGWVAAGLTDGDAIFAERTAWTFTDREEGLDFRNVGTRTQHGGTLTASTFLLSSGGKTRFFQNDVRAMNNTLFDHIQDVQLIQSQINAMPSLTQFQMQDQHQFAMVDVSFQLYQSQVNVTTGQRTEGVEVDSTTHQPRIHHMSVLLVRVTPGTQGTDAPMGGSGWLVSNYGLDLTDGLSITQPV